MLPHQIGAVILYHYTDEMNFTKSWTENTLNESSRKDKDCKPGKKDRGKDLKKKLKLGHGLYLSLKTPEELDSEILSKVGSKHEKLIKKQSKTNYALEFRMDQLQALGYTLQEVKHKHHRVWKVSKPIILQGPQGVLSIAYKRKNFQSNPTPYAIQHGRMNWEIIYPAPNAVPYTPGQGIQSQPLQQFVQSQPPTPIYFAQQSYPQQPLALSTHNSPAGYPPYVQPSFSTFSTKPYSIPSPGPLSTGYNNSTQFQPAMVTSSQVAYSKPIYLTNPLPYPQIQTLPPPTYPQVTHPQYAQAPIPISVQSSVSHSNYTQSAYNPNFPYPK